MGFLERRNNAVDGLLGEIFHGQDFRRGEASLAERRFWQLEHFLWCGNAPVGPQGFDAAENSRGGFARDGLVGDGFHQNFVRILRTALFHPEFLRFFD